MFTQNPAEISLMIDPSLIKSKSMSFHALGQLQGANLLEQVLWVYRREREREEEREEILSNPLSSLMYKLKTCTSKADVSESALISDICNIPFDKKKLTKSIKQAAFGFNKTWIDHETNMITGRK